MKLIIFTAGRQETVKTLIFLLFMSLLIAQTTAPAAAEVTEWKISPENPIVGDTIIIRGDADPDEKTNILVSFENEVGVSEGSYEYPLNDVIIPDGFDNRFTVEARGAEDLKVRVKMLIWITMSSEANGGTATVSQSRVPPGKYPIRIDGKAKGSSVDLKITAFQRIEADSEGKLSYRYNTKSIPAGKFEINLGGVTKEITLKDTLVSVESVTVEEETKELITPPVDQISTPTALDESTPAENGSNKDENIFKDKMNQETLPVNVGASTVEAERKEDKKENVYYTIGGIAAGLIVLFSYSRIKKTG